jgi:peptidoglycan/xylan/chitin deacetylase (PgdA/CDA1 family)
MVRHLLAGSAIVALLACGVSADVAREVAVTFDDLPVSHNGMSLARQQAVTRNILRACREAKVPAVGFVNESKLAHERHVALLAQWLDAGYELGNHTYSHRDLHRAELAEYHQEILRGETVTRALMQKRGRQPRWFRHPQLHTGRSLDVRHSVEAFLGKHGYRVAPVTLDNSEWIFARAYENAVEKGDAALQQRLGREYIAYMDRKLAYFEQQSQAHFGRNIRHVLLLHANALNGDWFDELAASMRTRGYGFIPLERALEDPAYRSADTYTGPAGITWLHRWVLSAGKKPLAGEPRTAQWVLDAAGMESE